jgi:hypothetical protein
VGTWGVGLFDDDIASDVRAEWRDAILGGASPEEATAALTSSFADLLRDPDDSTIFWMALAAAQSETGRLLPEVRDRALEIIDAGGDVERWAETGAARARRRQRVLARLADKLRGPQPPPKRLRPPRPPPGVRFDIGDVVHLRDGESGAEALAVVVDEEEYPRGSFQPVIEVLLWEGGPLPSRREMERLPCVMHDGLSTQDLAAGRSAPLRPHLVVAGSYRRDQVFGPHLGRVVERGINRKPSGDYRRGSAAPNAPARTSGMAWPTVVKWIAGPAFRREV